MRRDRGVLEVAMKNCSEVIILRGLLLTEEKEREANSPLFQHELTNGND
jgi:hypothetical protein